MPLPFSIVVFFLAALVIAVSGVKMTAVADRLADRTGLGEAVIGGVLLGLTTSLSGTVTSVTAAYNGAASLAVSNAIGGIAVQTVFLVVADFSYRRINLEHAAADLNNMLQAALLLLLLGLTLMAYFAPPFSVWAVHPVSVLLFAVYVLGTRYAVELRRKPMWRPAETRETRADTADEPVSGGDGLLPLVLRFAVLALLLGAAGYAIAESGAQISEDFGISATVVGAALTATATSLPELVTTLAAVRRGALQLAVGGILGGNAFDVLFLSLSDVAYRDGSIYHAMMTRDALLVAAAISMTAILLMGLIMRERRGIGFEGLAILVFYAGTLLVQIALG